MFTTPQPRITHNPAPEKMKTDTDIRQTGVTIVASGTPRPQPRPRFANGRVISTADSNAKFWIRRVAHACKQAMDIVGGRQSMSELIGDGALTVKMQFRFSQGGDPMAKPKAHKQTGKPHTSKPDADNLAKLVLDVMTRSGVIKDDMMVSSLTIDKVWSKNRDCGVTVHVTEYRPQFVPVGLTEKQGYPPEEYPDNPSWLKTALSQSVEPKKGEPNYRLPPLID